MGSESGRQLGLVCHEADLNPGVGELRRVEVDAGFDALNLVRHGRVALCLDNIEWGCLAAFEGGCQSVTGYFAGNSGFRGEKKGCGYR